MEWIMENRGWIGYFIAAIILIAMFFAWALCRIAAISDRRMEGFLPDIMENGNGEQ